MQVSDKDFLGWIYETSFDLESVVSQVNHMSVATKHKKGFIVSFNISTDLPGSPFTQFHTWLGRCFFVRFDFLLHPPSFVAITFNLTEVGRLAINAHTLYDEIGLNHGYWPVRPDTFVLEKQDVQAYLEYTKVIKVHKHNEGTKECLDEEGYDHPKCVAEWAKGRFKAMWEKEGTEL